MTRGSVTLGTLGLPELARSIRSAVSEAVAGVQWAAVLASVKTAVRYLSLHTGVPALVVAALLLCVGYRLVKRSARFLVQVALVTLSLCAATELGWISW